MGTATLGTSYTQAIDWFGTLRGRLGWAHGPVLVYATGGLAYGHIKTDEVVNTIPFLTGVTTMGSFSQTKIGWTAGAGVEGHLFGNWTAKAEYLYVNLGKLNCGISCGALVTDNVSFTTNIVRAGVNYRF